MSLYDQLAASDPTLSAGRVHCPHCGREATVDSAVALRDGWPTCCDATMTLGPWHRRDQLAAVLYGHILGYPPWEDRDPDEPIVAHYKHLATKVLRWLVANP